MLTLLYTRMGQDSRRGLLDRMKNSAARRCLLLVPENYSHESERMLCQVLGNGEAGRCEVLSFSRMASRLNDLMGGGAVPVLDGGGRILLMYAALRQVGDSLRMYYSHSKKPAFLTDLIATVDECRSYQVAPERLMEASERMEGRQGDKFHDIALIYQAYMDQCANSAADPKSRLDRLAEQLRDSRWAEGMEFYLHGYAGFSPQEEKVIEQLALQGDVTLAMNCDRGHDPDEKYEQAMRTIRRLTNLLGERNVRHETLEGYEKEEPSLQFLSRHLFGALPEPWHEETAITCVKATDPRREVEWAAAQILELLREDASLRLRDIAVCARTMDLYGELVESTFERYGIPVFSGNKDNILQKPVIALVTAALAAVAEDYAYEPMFRYLKTGLTGISAEERDRLENYVLTWNIRGSVWRREKPWDMHPEGYGKDYTDAQRFEVAQLDQLRRRVIQPLEDLRANPDQTGMGRVRALYDFLLEIGLPEQISDYIKVLEEKHELSTAAQYRQLWDILIGALEQCALQMKDTRMDADEFAQLFALALSQYDVGTIPVSLDRVTVSDATRLTYKQVKVLFFLGTDGNHIPNCSPNPGLFSDQDRDALGEAAVELAPKQDCLLRRELAIAGETCAIPTQQLFLSYSSVGAGGEEQGPCFLWNRITALFPDCRVIAADSCRSRLAAPVPALELVRESETLANVLCKLPDFAPRVAQVMGAAHWRRGSLSPVGVEKVFGQTVGMSATRLDQLNSCHFQHFLHYGLDAKPRKRAEFRPTEYGTFVHAVLESVLGQAEANGGIAVLAGDDALRHKLAVEAMEIYEREALPNLEEEPARFRYLFERMKRTALAVTDSVVAELAVSKFKPVEFELGFGPGKDLPPIEAENGVKLRLSGFVDRVDEWLHDGKRYLRIMDYKTGKKSFDFSDVEDGRGLQMLLYLFTLSRFAGENTVPAGVLYIPARDPVVKGERSMTDEAAARERSRLLNRQGLMLDDAEVIAAMEELGERKEYRFLPIGTGRGSNDYLVTPEQMVLLDEYVNDALKDAAGHIASGNVDADPYWHDAEHNACRWCEYQAACHFEPECGDSRRWRKAMKAREFWQWMLKRKEGEQNGD